MPASPMPVAGRVEGLLAHRLALSTGIIIEGEGIAWDAQTLLDRAARITGLLQRSGVGPGDRVGLLVGRAPVAIAAWLGILGAGAAWVPLDPALPAARRAELAAEAGLARVLTGEGLDLPGATCLPLAAAANCDPGLSVPNPGDIAYVLFTSGSTGRPKGAQIPHEALAHVMIEMGRRLGLAPGEIALATAPFSFDMALVDVLVPLYAGGRVRLHPSAADGAALVAALDGVQHWNATPSALRLALAAGLRPKAPLRVLSAGEALDPALAAALCDRGITLWNGYGLTETGVGSTFGMVDPADIDAGLPLPGVTVEIWDPAGRALPPGERGEVVIGGPGLLRGYLRGDPEGRLVTGADGAPRFRTGDAGLLRPSGALVVHGRLDAQLKIDGARVEPAEVEAHLLRAPGVQAAAVGTHPSWPGQLVAWLVGDGDSAGLRAALRERLAAALVPQVYCWLPTLPLSPAGKVDRAALPAPGAGRASYLPPFRAPASPEEAAVVAAFAEALERDDVGADDPLLDLGGRSLHATLIAARLGPPITVADVLAAGSPAALAARRLPPSAPTGPQAEGPSAEALGLLALSTLAGADAAYRTAIALHIEGADGGAALAAVLDHHPALRARLDPVDGRLVHGPPGAVIEALADDAAVEAFLRRPFDRLSRVGRRPDGALLLLQHHAITDAWSVGLLVAALHAQLTGLRLPPAPPWRCPPSPPAAPWAEALAGAPLFAAIPGGNTARAPGGAAHLCRRRLPLGPAGRALGRRFTPTAQVLAALAAHLYTQTGQDDLLLGAVLSHRDDPLFTDVPGYLASTLPLRLRPAGTRSALLVQAQGALGAAIPHRGLSHAALLRALQAPRAADLQPLVQICVASQEGPPWRKAGGGLVVEAASVDLGASPYDLLVRLTPEADAFALELSGRIARLPDPAALEALADGLVAALVALWEEPEAALVVAGAPERRDRLRAQPCADAELAWLDAVQGLVAVGVPAGGAPVEGLALRALPRSADGAFDPAALRASLAAPKLPPPPLHLDALFPPPPPPPVAPPMRGQGPALRHGGPLPPPLPGGLIGLLERAADQGCPLTFLDADDREDVLGADALWAEARAIAGGLGAAGLARGEVAVLAFEAARDLLPALWACFLGGFVALPVAAPHSVGHREARSRLAGALALSGGRLVASPAVQAIEGQGLDGIALRACAPGDLRRRDDADLALLLLTSGSTGAPKGVTQRQGAILGFLDAYTAAVGLGPGDVLLNWLGLDHVAPLLMTHGAALRRGLPQVHAPTVAFLADPARALDWTHRYRASSTFVPNFAFGLMAAAAEAAPAGRWDLRCARAFANGGETITPATCARFLAATAPFGFPAGALVPIWGMSETCSATILRRGLAEGAGPSAPLGGPIAGLCLRVVDGDDRVLEGAAEGRLQVRGPLVTTGYFGRPDADAEAFTADGWFDTGDQAALGPDGLVITGRSKEVIILGGRNIGCHELEAVVEDLPGVERSFVAATAARPPGADTDAVALFFASPLAGPALGALLAEIERTVAAHIGERPRWLIPVERSAIPKTEIGKLQRGRLRAGLLRGDFDEALRAADLLREGERTLPRWFFTPARLPRPAWTPAAGPCRWEGDPSLLVGVFEAGGGPTAALVYGVGPGPDDLDGALDLVEELRLIARPGAMVLVVCPAARPVAGAALAALLATLHQERPGLRSRLVVVEPGTSPAALRAERSEGGPAFEQVFLGPTGRRVAGLRPLEFGPPQPAPVGPGDLVLLAGGVGGVGALLGPALVESFGVSLLLVGRRAEEALPADAIAALGRLRAALRPGAILRYAALDVADGEALEAAVVDAEAAAGRPLRLALHLAVDAPLRLLAEEDRASLAAATRAKVRGLEAVAAVVERRPGARAVHFGSVLDHQGGVGMGAYGLAGRLAAALVPGVVSLCWSAWAGVGLGRLGGGRAQRGLLPLTPTQARRSFLALLHQGLPAAFIGIDPADPAQAPWIEGAPVAPLAPAPRPPAREGPRPETATERQLAGIWRGLLLLDVVPRDQGFFDLGGQSLTLAQMRAEIAAQFHQELPLPVLLANPTLQSLAAHLDGLAVAEAPAATDRAARQRAALRRRRP